MAFGVRRLPHPNQMEKKRKLYQWESWERREAEEEEEEGGARREEGDGGDRQGEGADPAGAEV